MIEAFTLKSRGKDMVCLLEYADPSVRGKKVILYKHGFFGNKITPHRIMVAASHRLQQEGYTICRFDCVGAARATAIIQPFMGRLKTLRWCCTGLRNS